MVSLSLWLHEVSKITLAHGRDDTGDQTLQFVVGVLVLLQLHTRHTTRGHGRSSRLNGVLTNQLKGTVVQDFHL